jgi:hypothetical protein
MFSVYLILFVIATCMVHFMKHYHTSFKWFGYTLLFLLCTEFVAGYFTHVNRETGFPTYLIYHASIPLFLILIYNFFKSFIQEIVIRKIVLALIVSNSILSLYLTIFFYHFKGFPGIQLNTMGTIMIGVSLYVLLTLEPIPRTSIYKHPIAWICLGYIVFFAATFFLNGISNKLVESSSPYRSLIHMIFNQYSNVFLYSCIIIGLWLSNRLTRQAISQN